MILHNLFSSPKEYTLRTHISSNQTGYAIAKAIVTSHNGKISANIVDDEFVIDVSFPNK